MDIQEQINQIRDRLTQLEGRIPLTLTSEIEDLKFKTLDLAHIAGAAVVNTPTATGYVPFIINGQRINLMTGS